MQRTCPMTSQEIVDAYFLETRAKVLDIAAFLDRLDRGKTSGDDFRVQALRDVIACLIDGNDDRVRRIQVLLSDHSTDPIEAAPMQGAFGAPPKADGTST
ncbi:MAG: hypothetical protein P8I91_00165 [Phycisphaerales bacterium]|nr:hypothetical protein [Phycisphaerales bacterium]